MDQFSLQIYRRSPELDHIIPLSKGGAHTPENTQCVCRQCNSEKADKPLGQQWLEGFAYPHKTRVGKFIIPSQMRERTAAKFTRPQVLK